jgi:hypothetical protein
MQIKYDIKNAISRKVHLAKCDGIRANGGDFPAAIWDAINTDSIADSLTDEIKRLIELYLYLPCCHVSGMHNPSHFEQRKYICELQKAEALERFCHDLGINPVTRSKIDCSWCESYPAKRAGEGLHLFEEEKENAVVPNDGK